MSFKQIDLHNFRSYQEKSFTLSPNTTVITGLNGSGKTNILEALHLLASTKSFRALDKELIREGAEWYKVTAKYSTKTAEIRFEPNKQPPKQTLINQKKVKTEEYVGQVKTVLFEPEMLRMVGGSPEGRRRFLDSVLSLTHPEYFQHLIAYRRTLKQRNSLLRENPRAKIENQVFAWDIKLVESATQIVKWRQKFSNFLNKGLADTYSRLAGTPTTLTLSYQTLSSADYPSMLSRELSRRLERDRLLGHTSIGPHRDDLTISLGDSAAAQVASRGESRSIVLSLKLLESRYIETETKQLPTLLLDDVFSELDESRQQLLVKLLTPQQTVITTTHLEEVKKALPKNHQLIELGK